MSKEKIDRQYQKGLIITDDIAIEPILDFELYRSAIANIIKNSYPKFTIGIFGDWGTGKTTLMNAIYEILEENKNDIVRVRFEAWRYEREEQFALIPLLKTIAFALPEDEKFKNLKRKLKRGAINFIKKTPDIISSIISKNINEEAGTITKEAFTSFKNEFNSKMELLAEVDRDTLYFDGFDDIKNEINKIQNDNPNFKIVVFVDDLDRCSPTKALEVLESIKVFLGMEGFIYIIGLSHDIVTKLIDIEYEKKGVKGEQYIKKIIQIPITLPKWIRYDIVKLINYLIEKEIINTKYKEIFTPKNIDLVSEAIENNPREIKRFLNNFIVAFEIFKSMTNFNANELLIIQVIQLRWINFYLLLINSADDFREKLLNEINKYLKLDEEKRIQILGSDEVKIEESKEFDLKIRKILRNLEINHELWKVLERNFDILNNIKDLHIYRRAIEVSKEPIKSKDISEEAFILLKNGKINEFNERRKIEFPELYLSKVDLSRAKLSGADLSDANLLSADLSKADLHKANLSGANLLFADLTGANLLFADLTGTDLPFTKLLSAKLSYANLLNADLIHANLLNAELIEANLVEAKLSEANLSGANLSRTNLSRANLSDSYLYDADLSGADLSDAHLSGADLYGADLSDANLSGADLTNSLIINLKNFELLKLNKNTKFEKAIIDDYKLIQHIEKFTEYIPEKIKNKYELKMKLEERLLDEEYVEFLLRMSHLPEE